MKDKEQYCSMCYLLSDDLWLVLDCDSHGGRAGLSHTIACSTLVCSLHMAVHISQHNAVTLYTHTQYTLLHTLVFIVLLDTKNCWNRQN